MATLDRNDDQGPQLLPYTLLLTIADTFRNKPRLALTQVSLVGSGIIFITVLGVRDSTNYTFGTELMSIHQYQVTLQFEEDETAYLVKWLIRAVLLCITDAATNLVTLHWQTGRNRR